MPEIFYAPLAARRPINLPEHRGCVNSLIESSDYSLPVLIDRS